LRVTGAAYSNGVATGREVQPLHQLPGLPQLGVRQRDLGVVGLVRREPDGGAAVQVDLDQVADEQDAPPLVVQHGVAGEVPAGAVHDQPGRQLVAVVGGPGDDERLGPGQVVHPDRQHGRGELVLQLPQRAVAVHVARAERDEPAAAPQLAIASGG
jgi:hypothetical protein